MNTKTLLMFVAVTLGVLMGVGGLLYQFGQTSEAPIEDIAGGKLHSMGSGEIVLVEFSDFQCPACLAVQEPLKQILQKFEGKVQFVYRHFPLSSIHKNAQLAAQASEAAHMQGKFFEMHDKLFVTQMSWGSMADPREEFYKFSDELGLEREKFVADMESQVASEVVAADAQAAARYRLSGTPTFFLNGAKIDFGQIETKLTQLTK